MIKRESNYEKDIMKLIIEQLNISQNSLVDALSSNKELDLFFDESGHIHGGWWYKNSRSGMAIEEFDSNSITIYNNFEGKLYKASGFGYDIYYDNSDYIVNNATAAIDSYISTNKGFEESVLSPGGGMKCIFFWGNSEIHYFLIKTLDNSKPDFAIGVPAGDFAWLNDEYILYLNAWSSAPYIVKVVDDYTYDAVNIMYDLGVFDKDDYYQDFSFDYRIRGIKGNIITLYDEENKKEYKVEFSSKAKKLSLKPVE